MSFKYLKVQYFLYLIQNICRNFKSAGSNIIFKLSMIP